MDEATKEARERRDASARRRALYLLGCLAAFVFGGWGGLALAILMVAIVRLWNRWRYGV